jgi:outer membrane protein TolC
MPTRSQVCAWIGALGVLAPAVAFAQERSERDVVELILRDGPEARAIQAESDVTRREQRARLAYPNPTLTYSRESAGFTEFLQAEQALPIFGVRGALARAGAAAIAAAEAERDVQLSRLRAKAADAAARVVAEQARLDAARALVSEVERLIGILRTREREGEGSRFDRLRAEQELRDGRQVSTAASASLVEARTALAALLPAGIVVTHVTAGSPVAQVSLNFEGVMARALSVRAELRALAQSAERASLESDAARRSRMPSPTVFGGFKRADDAGERQRGGVVGLSVSIGLFDRGARESARWLAEAERVAAEREAVERRIRAEIAGALEMVALREAAAIEEEPAAAQELVEIAHVAYREGDIGILELLDSVRTASRARLREIDARLALRQAQIALERAAGETLWP